MPLRYVHICSQYVISDRNSCAKTEKEVRKTVHEYSELYF